MEPPDFQTTFYLAREEETQADPRLPALEPEPCEPVSLEAVPASARAFLDLLCQLRLLTPELVQHFLARYPARLASYTTSEAVGQALVEADLLTPYQLRRLLRGSTHGLVIGSYRILDRIGAGGAGVVYLAEHLLLKRLTALKVVQPDDDCPAQRLERFFAEMRVQASLQDAHIVTAYDAGQIDPADSELPPLIYLAMEYVSGGDLEHYAKQHTPVPAGQACDFVAQAALGVEAAHAHHLIHRDIKPSNLLLTSRREVKLSDFGSVRELTNRITGRGVLMGTVDFIAPEQCTDAAAVGMPVDIFGLGATLFWMLAGEGPYPRAHSIVDALLMRREQLPRRLRSLRPDAPSALELLIDRMLDRDPSRRPSLASVRGALERFAKPAVLA